MEIKEKQSAQEAKKNALPDKRNRFVRYGAVAAAVLLIAGGILGALLATGRQAGNPADNAMTASASAAEATAAEAAPESGRKTLSAEPGTVRAMQSYDELYGLFETLQANNAALYGVTTDADAGAMPEAAAAEPASGGAAMESAAPAPESPKAAAEGRGACLECDFSETNTQVRGVDEADVVKTDGKYIYYLAGSQFNIIEAAGDATKLLSSVMLGNDDKWWSYAAEMFLSGDRLMIIAQGYTTVWAKSSVGGYNDTREQTRVLLYDVSNPEKPREIATLGQSGSYLSSRMIGEYVYIVTSHYVWQPVRGEIATYVPEMFSGDAAKAVPANDILVYGTPKNSAYTVIGAINLASGTDYASAKAVFGGASDVYCNTEHLLLSNSEYDRVVGEIAPDETGRNVQITEGSSQTKLILFALDGEKITLTANATVPGTLVNQFAVDEYNGVFRLATTCNNNTERIYTDGVDTYEYDDETFNCLYTLDQSLAQLGAIENIAKDEWIESVRFDGDVGYFVTFRQVDPLFAVDLADPAHPKLLSELKIPGFSEYLHVYGEGLLLGLGYEADAETGATKGVKLSMFNVANTRNVTELTTAHVDASWTVVGSNHKAILVSAERNLIAFPADDSYFIYRYEAGGFQQLARVRMDGSLSSWNLRGLFIGEYFYVLSEEGVTVISMKSWEKIAHCVIAYG